MTISPRTIKAPIAPSDLCRQKRRTSLSARGIPIDRRSGSGTGTVWTESAIGSVPDPRVDHGVAEISQQVARDDDDDHEQVDALDDRVVALEDGVHEELPHARQPEDRLNDH